MTTVHIIGAGISGLAAATALADAHVPVKLHEASSAAGGRCRSSNDGVFTTIDHGLHLFSGAARELQRFIQRIDAGDRFERLRGPFTISDGRTGQNWQIGRNRPVPAAPLVDQVQLLGHLIHPGDGALDTMLSDHSPLQDALLAPLARLALTQPPAKATARQLQRLVRRHVRRGGSRFYLPRRSLQESFIAPALNRLEYLGGSVYFGQALKQLEMNADGVTQLTFARKKLALMPQDVVILATPAHVTRQWLPQVATPRAQHQAITLHYACAHHEPVASMRFLTNAAADLLRYDDGAIHAAIRVADHVWHSNDVLLAQRVWHSIRALHPYLPTESPHCSVWREKRAGHVPQDDALPAPNLPPRLLLAGDWLDATRPATLEAAALHGHRAAAQALLLLGKQPGPSQYDFYLN